MMAVIYIYATLMDSGTGPYKDGGRTIQGSGTGPSKDGGRHTQFYVTINTHNDNGHLHTCDTHG